MKILVEKIKDVKYIDSGVVLSRKEFYEYDNEKFYCNEFFKCYWFCRVNIMILC